MTLARLKVLVLAVSTALILVTPASAERRVAMVIGIDDYQHDSLPDLKNARRDARGVAATLEELGFEVDLLIDANRRQFSRALDAFEAKMRDADVGLMFYAGHGVQSDGVNWLIPADAAIDIEADLRLGGVDAMEFMDAMERSGGKLNVIILDACRDNPLPQRKRSNAKGLAPLSSSSGRTAIIYAAAPGQTAADGKPGEHSVFTGELIQSLNKPGLTLEEVFKSTAQKVSERTGGRQLPWLNTSFTGTFYFRPAAPKAAALSDQPKGHRNLQMEALFWQTIKDSDNPADFAAYLNQFPGGTFAELARARMIYFSDNRRIRTEPLPGPSAQDPKVPMAATKTEEKSEPMTTAATTPVRDTTTQAAAPAPDTDAISDASTAGELTEINAFVGPVIIPKRKPVEEIALAALTRSARVKGGGRINLRRGPGTEYPVVGQAHPDSQLVIIGADAEEDNQGEAWLKVASLNGRAGYVLASLIDKENGQVTNAGPTPVSAGETFRDCTRCPEMVVIKPGRFLLGDLHLGGESGLIGEYPVREVTLDYRFAVGKFEVTQGEWIHFMKKNPSKFKGMTRPVENISFEDVQAFLTALSEKTGKPYRLLSEAEWEYITRAGTTTQYPWGDELKKGIANCEDCGGPRAKKGTRPVGSFPANPLGLHDLNGNVREWTTDCMSETYSHTPDDGGPNTAGDCTLRITRGGSWDDDGRMLRSAARNWSFGGDHAETIGFRVAVTLDP